MDRILTLNAPEFTFFREMSYIILHIFVFNFDVVIVYYRRHFWSHYFCNVMVCRVKLFPSTKCPNKWKFIFLEKRWSKTKMISFPYNGESHLWWFISHLSKLIWRWSDINAVSQIVFAINRFCIYSWTDWLKIYFHCIIRYNNFNKT